MKVRNTHKAEKIELQMTPMIDIVFQLLIFFIMTFKIVVPEGDFNIRMPVSAPAAGPPDPNQLPPIKVRLRADAGGTLTNIQMNETGLGRDFSGLRNNLMSVVGNERGAGSIAETAEVELDCDYGLRYEFVIQAITAISGYRAEDGSVVKLIEKIKFSPPKKPG
jgi:biopolymer transport protein ExbD